MSQHKSKKTQPPIIDCWDAGDSSDTEIEATSSTPHSQPPKLFVYPSAPPPTPKSRPQSPKRQPDFSSFPSVNFAERNEQLPIRDLRTKLETTVRPEKTTATASRLIAGALGVKAPKRTEEQRQYDRAVRENEARKREKEREEKKKQEVEKQKAIKAMWDD